MREKGTIEYTIDHEIERTIRARLRVAKAAQASTLEIKETLTEESMVEEQNPP
jgi:hypothetical protein